MTHHGIGLARAGDLTLMPYVVKTDLFGLGSERLHIAAELGRLVVPERRDDPDSALIELAFVRLKSTAETPGAPLVFLAGGPGVSGTDGLRWEYLAPWFAALRTVGDVITLDQRGTGLSNPRLDCLERWDLPLDRPGTRDEMVRAGLERSRSAAAFWRERGVDLAGYTTAESADDVDALRQALGAEKINLYGASYGSHLALATIKRHAAHIARAVVALVEGPDHTIKLPSAIQAHLERLHRLVAADLTLNQAIPDFLGLMRHVLDRLDQDPVAVDIEDDETGETVRVVAGGFDLRLVTAQGIGDRGFISALPARYDAMAHGDFTWLAEEVLAMRRGWLGNAMAYLMDCASGVSPERAARVREGVTGTLLGDLIDFPFPDVCAAWGAPDLGPEFRAPVHADVPTLFISGTLDGRTPVSNAEEVRAGFVLSPHLIVEGGTHSTAELATAPGVQDAMIAFLKGQPLPMDRASIPFVFAPLDREGKTLRIKGVHGGRCRHDYVTAPPTAWLSNLIRPGVCC